MIEMARTSPTKARSVTRAPGRSGRPPNEIAGEVEERILDAARKVFLDRGFEGASIEEIADVARSGKPTIYARFRDKKALFTAAVTRYVIAKQAQLESYSPSGTTIDERLASVGVILLQEALTPEWINLLRLSIAEARRFPDLGGIVIRMTRERGTEIMMRLLGEVAESSEVETFPAFDPGRLAMTARYFIDLILLPQLMRALSGEHQKTLHAEIGPHVSQRVAFFLSACRNGGIR
ncbi:TetR/AcrR family transcriptional regulator [Bradyrhizobium sp. Ash2021]|uniref:TetR/AcrR family transcriptional regulator n=1 Tax=Bradyrhizobium sp. Ash2021 TaxID=2954771 RepID=UPI00281662FB|nr:TetR/AcrR family transcriptional regulator [Bradyrhizobium sp. Ash2021]WMT74110.1 TetR/AcrR family transcriptional regulator [Bradyrhizobium sp. Ash2021]